MTVSMVFGLLGAGCLAVLAGLHMYWAYGGNWPGRDRTDLAALVVGRAGRPMPGRVPLLTVAFVLLSAAYLVGAWAGLVPLVLPVAMHRFAVVTIAALLVSRGAVGVGWQLLQQSEHRFHRLDLRLYSPVATVLGLSVALVLPYAPYT